MLNRGLQGRAPARVTPASRALTQGRRVVRVQSSAGNPVAGEKYDYVIVGGGTAGCVLANRLSADGKSKVLVLEAGPAGDALEVAVPAGLTRLFKHPVLDWGLDTLTQKQLLAREIYLARGRLLGGSSGTNATLYHRGTPEDYANWGLEGWGPKDVLDWFIKAENYEQGPKPFHGVGGAMNVEQPRYDNPLHGEFFRAAAQLGIKANPDFNDWSRPQDGYGEFQVAQKQGERADMYRMYLKPAMSRGNLKVVTGARTTKVHFDKGASGPVARGVEFSTDGPFGAKHTAELAAHGEVLMCAGTVHTPHLLMLSGVGPSTTLAEHGIPLVADLPALGSNLQDHPACVFAAKAKPEFDDLAVTSQIYDKKSNIKIGVVLQYLFGRNGPLATTGCDHGAFVRTSSSHSQPDLQVRFVPGFALDPDGVRSYVIFGELKKQGKAWPGGITMQLLAIRAKSKGSIGLKSADPFIAPAIDINYLADPTDMATLKEGLRLARRIAEAEPLRKYLATEEFPGPAMSSDADLEAYIRRTVHSGNALVGTCALGSCVSPTDLTLNKVSGVRVVDASVLPQITGGQTGAPTVMVAERAAALMTGKAPIVSKKLVAA